MNPSQELPYGFQIRGGTRYEYVFGPLWDGPGYLKRVKGFRWLKGKLVQNSRYIIAGHSMSWIERETSSDRQTLISLRRVLNFVLGDIKCPCGRISSHGSRCKWRRDNE